MRRTILFFLIVPLVSFGQKKITVEQYVSKYRSLAQSEMTRTGIPASITLAQGILESGFGNSELAKKARNHFGIKCHTGWKGKGYYMDDDERNECFRVYSSPEESYIDHSEFLVGRARYNSLFELSPTDYKGWAKGLKKAGYATNPKYATILIGLIDKYNLHQYDKRRIKISAPPVAVVKREQQQTVMIDRKDEQPQIQHTPSDRDYVTPKDKEDFLPESEKLIFDHNGIRTVRVAENESLRRLSYRFRIPIDKLAAYNDMAPNMTIKPGTFIYLDPKKKRTYQNTHLIQDGENILYVSQLYGIKLDVLRKRNQLGLRDEPAINEVVYLNKNAPYRPKVRSNTTVYNKMSANKKPVELKVIPIAEKEEHLTNSEKKVAVANEKEDRLGKEIVQKEEVAAVVKKESVKRNPNVREEPEEVIYDVELLELKPMGQNNLTASLDADHIYHTVVRGDTLYSLSKKYGIEIEDIKVMNNLEGTNLKLGQILTIQK